LWVRPSPEEPSVRPRWISRARLALLSACFLLVATPPPGWCAWPHDPYQNLQVAPTSTHQVSPSVASDAAGGAYIAWEDDRVPGCAIYVQRVTASGATAPGWPATGRAVCTATGDQVLPVAIADGAGGVIIAWTDYRAGAANADVYASRVTAAGTIAPGWPANGRQLISNNNNDHDPVIASDGARGAYVFWWYDAT